jgi:hypothetical protein
LQLDADAKRKFFCEEAWWGVAAMEPFTPACISGVHAEANEGPERLSVKALCLEAYCKALVKVLSTAAVVKAHAVP